MYYFPIPLNTSGEAKKEAAIGLVTRGVQPNGIFLFFDVGLKPLFLQKE